MQYDYDYFISYAHKNNENPNVPGFVEKFEEKLRNSEEHQRLFGEKLRIFFDKSEIQNMVQWDSKIRSGLASSRFLIVLLSPEYFQSEYCAKEFDWWMKHEMHRCTLGEGTAPILIYDVANLQDSNAETIPDIPEDLQLRFPNWLKQIRKIQSDLKFDMHNLLIAKIDDVLNALRDGVKDKVRHQDISDGMPRGKDYPKYNKKFVGRRENLLSLRKNFTEETGKSASALTGLGGFGKTELALTYGHAFGWDYQLGRFFKPCDNCNTIYDAILTCGIMEMHGLKPEGSYEEQLQALYKHLEAKRKEIINQNVEDGILRTEGAHLLLILDNVNNLDLISQLIELELPDYFHVIITTRENTNEFTNIYSESVERLSEDESVELLNNLRLFDSPEEALAARNIAQLLAGYTLIVEITGAYLARNKSNKFITYQSQYEQLVKNHGETFRTMAETIQKASVKNKDLMLHTSETVSAVMESTLSTLKEKAPNARRVLDFISLMSPDSVAVGWLPELCRLNEDEVKHEIVSELTGYSLLMQLENEPNLARIHRLVADTVKQDIPEDVQKEIIAKIREKCKALLKNDEKFWCTPENSWNITPVFEFCLSLTEQKSEETSDKKIHWKVMDIWDFTDMLEKSGLMLISLGRINEARKVFKRHLEISEEGIKSFPSSITRKALSVSYLKLGDLERNAGNAAAAREYFEKSLENWQQLSESDWKLQGLGLLYNRLGDLEKNAGNAAAAREWYEKALEIAKRLAEQMPDDVTAQRDLSISYNKLGDLEKAAGNAAAAREWYEKTLEIRKRLADLMPDNVVAQQNLSYSYGRLGDLENAAGNAAAAREWYEKALEIRKRLAGLMPDDVGAQRDLSISYERLGDLERDAGNAAAAREWYEKALEIAQRLAEKMPDNVEAQRDLSVSYNKLGNLEQAAGNAAAAREWYEKMQEILKRLADLMPDSVQAQRDLSISYERLGDLEKAAGNVAAAREWYEKALEIALRLAEKMPGNVQAQRDLSEYYNDLGNLEIAANNPSKAEEWSNKALKILEPLVHKTPDDIRSQMVLGKVYRCLGDSEASSSIQAALDWYEKAQKIFQRLVDKSPENVEYQKDLAETQEKIAQARLVDKSPESVELQKDLTETQEKIEQERPVDKSSENAEFQKELTEAQEKLAQAQKELAEMQEKLVHAQKQPWYIAIFNKLFRRG